MEVLMGNSRTMIMFSIIEKIDIVVLPEDILRGQRKFPATCRAIHKEGGGPNNGQNKGEEEVDNEEEDSTPSMNTRE